MVQMALSMHWLFVVGRLPPFPFPTSCSALLLVLSYIGTLLVVACGVDVSLEKGRFSTSCTVSVAHAFFNGTGAGFLLPCLIVGLFGAGVRSLCFVHGFLFLWEQQTGGSMFHQQF